MSRSKNPLYRKWYAFYYGCTQPQARSWRHYGGQGIKMYGPWAALGHGFDLFADWVEANLGAQPSPEHELTRKDTTKDVRPGNLCWRTVKELGRSRRTNVLVRYQGQTKTLAEWSEITGINFKTLWSRLYDRGLKPKEAFKNVRPYRKSH
jgi:hypothetical protein